MPEGSLSFFRRWSFGTLFGVLVVVVLRISVSSQGDVSVLVAPIVGDSGAVIGD
jgi:hypothetical protein